MSTPAENIVPNREEMRKLDSSPYPVIYGIDYMSLAEGRVQFSLHDGHSAIRHQSRIGKKTDCNSRGRVALGEVQTLAYDPVLFRLIPFIETGNSALLPDDAVLLSGGDTITRGISVFLPDARGQMRQFNISGFGVGRTVNDVTSYTAPDVEKTGGDLYRGIGINSFATTYVQTDGRKKIVMNQEPAGAYSEESLMMKIGNTVTLNRMNLDVSLPQVLAYGFYKDLLSTKEGRVGRTGWQIYEIEPFITANMLLQVSLSVDHHKKETQHIYNRWMYKIGQFMQSLHYPADDTRPGMVHNQMHGGNLGLALRENSFVPIINDFGTLQSLAGFSPQAYELATMNDRLKALSSNLIVMARHIKRPDFVVHEVADQIVWFMDGYQGSPMPDNKQFSENRQLVVERLKKVLRFLKSTDINDKTEQELLRLFEEASAPIIAR